MTLVSCSMVGAVEAAPIDRDDPDAWPGRALSDHADRDAPDTRAFEMAIGVTRDAVLLASVASAAAATTDEGVRLFESSHAGSEAFFALLRQDFAVDEVGVEGLAARFTSSLFDAGFWPDAAAAAYDDGTVMPYRLRAALGTASHAASENDGSPFRPGSTVVDRRDLSIVAFLKMMIAEPVTWVLLVLGLAGVGWVQSKFVD